MLRRLAGLSPADRSLLVRATWWVIVLSGAIRIVGFRRTRALAERPLRSPRARRLDPIRAGWAVEAVGRRFPGARCLVRALATVAILRRAALRPDLRIGVARGDRRPLDAHAWVEVDGVVVVGAEEREAFRALPHIEPGS